MPYDPHNLLCSEKLVGTLSIPMSARSRYRSAHDDAFVAEDVTEPQQGSPCVAQPGGTSSTARPSNDRKFSSGGIKAEHHDQKAEVLAHDQQPTKGESQNPTGNRFPCRP